MKKLFALMGLLGLVAGMDGALKAQEELDKVELRGRFAERGVEQTLKFKFSATLGDKFAIDWRHGKDTLTVETEITEFSHTFSTYWTNVDWDYDITLSAINQTGRISRFEIDSAYRYTSVSFRNCPMLKSIHITHNDLTNISFINCPALTFLDCSYNKIGSLFFWPDSNWYDNLTYLNCSRNDILEFTATDCIALETLDCSNNPELWSLTTDDCKAMKSLDCSNTQLLELYLPTQSVLQTLDCSNTQLNSMYLSELPALRTLDCSDNPQLTQLTIQCPSLDTLLMNRNPQLFSLSIYDSRLTGIDLSDNTALIGIVLQNNTMLETLDLSNLSVLEQLTCTNSPELKTLDCSNTQLTSLYLSELPALQILNCSNTQLTTFSLSELPELQTLDCSDNPQLTDLTIQCPNLDSLNMHGNTQLTSLVVSYSRLTALDLSGNTQLTSLSLSELPALQTLDCSNTQLTYLFLSELQTLQTFNCNKTQLIFLKLPELPALQTLDCSNTQLTSLSLSELPALRTLDCSNNPHLTSLTIQCPSLASLRMHGNTQLTSLHVAYSRLTALDLSGNTQLTSLDCHHNQLSSLDVTDCHNLQFINCTNNHLSFIDLPKEFAGVIDCDSNHIPLSGLASLLKQCAGARFDPQLIINRPIQIGQTLDLRSEMQGSDYNVEYTVYIDSTEADNRFYTIRNSLFAFHKSGNYRVKLSSSLPLGMNTILIPGSVYYDLTVVDSIARPTFSVPSGKVKRGTDVTLSTTTPDAHILYTTDGSTPDTKDALEYASPIRINSPMTIKAITVCDTVISQVATATYTVDSVANENDLKASDLRVYAKDRTIYLSEAVGKVEVFTVDGHCIYRGFDTVIPVGKRGLYIVSVAGWRWKVSVR